MPRSAKGEWYMSGPDPAVLEAIRWLRFSEEDLNLAKVNEA